MLTLSIICLGVYMQVCDPSSGLVPLQTCEQGEGILSLLPDLADRQLSFLPMFLFQIISSDAYRSSFLANISQWKTRMLDGDTECHLEKAFIDLLPEPFVSFFFESFWDLLYFCDKGIVVVSAMFWKKYLGELFSPVLRMQTWLLVSEQSLKQVVKCWATWIWAPPELMEDFGTVHMVPVGCSMHPWHHKFEGILHQEEK